MSQAVLLPEGQHVFDSSSEATLHCDDQVVLEL
jgi:hypothetical protein